MINWLIRLLSRFARPIEGNPNEWLERDYMLLGEVWKEFHCGSVRGIYRATHWGFEILAVQNTKKNNDFDKVLRWFDNSSKRYKCSLFFLNVNNPKLETKLRNFGFTGDRCRMVKTFK